MAGDGAGERVEGQASLASGNRYEKETEGQEFIHEITLATIALCYKQVWLFHLAGKARESLEDSRFTRLIPDAHMLVTIEKLTTKKKVCRNLQDQLLAVRKAAMVKNIFVNLPVSDLTKSINFFKKLGFSLNPKFSDDTAASLILGENIFAMLLVNKRFQMFTKKEVCDAKKATEVLVAIDAESREQVDELVDKAVRAGGKVYREPENYGWMYSKSFEDLDGHQWEVVWMDPDKFEEAPGGNGEPGGVNFANEPGKIRAV